MVFVPVVVLQVVERMVIPVPGFDHHTPVPSPLRWSSGVSGRVERPSGESGGDRGTRDGSEGQVEHPGEGGYGTQGFDDRDG